jgi:hypothetical protein
MMFMELGTKAAIGRYVLVLAGEFLFLLQRAPPVMFWEWNFYAMLTPGKLSL